MSNPAALAEGKKILVVDNDTHLRRLFERFFDEQGYRVRAVENIEQMDHLLSRELFQLVVLDLIFPGEDGLATCRCLREQNGQVLIIMLTTKGGEGNCIQGPELGADNYLIKSFSPRELLVRVKTVLCRQASLMPSVPASADEVVISGGYQLFLTIRELKRGDEIHMLIIGEFVVFKAPMRHTREPLTRDKLMNLACGRGWDALERSTDVQTSRLHRLIESDPFKLRYIRTVWGVDYVFVSDGNAHKTWVSARPV